MPQQPSTLKFIQFELNCSHFLCRLGVSSLDRPQQHLTTLAHQHDPEPAFHPAGELGRGVFGFRAAGWHGVNLDMETPRVESVGNCRNPMTLKLRATHLAPPAYAHLKEYVVARSRRFLDFRLGDHQNLKGYFLDNSRDRLLR